MRFQLYKNYFPFPLLLQKVSNISNLANILSPWQKVSNPSHRNDHIDQWTIITDPWKILHFSTSTLYLLLQSLMKENSKYQTRACQDLPESGTRWQIWPIFANFLFQRSSSRNFSILATSAPEVICDLKETKETRCDGKDRFIGDLFIQSQWKSTSSDRAIGLPRK